jgi:hypothetical protein
MPEMSGIEPPPHPASKIVEARATGKQITSLFVITNALP